MPERTTEPSVTLSNDTQVAIDVAVLKATQSTHERRITAVEKTLWWALVTGLAAALSSTGTLVLFLLSKVHFQ